MQLGRNYIDKLDFIDAFKPTRMAVLNALNIHSGFITAGLISCNSQRVLSHLYCKLRTPIFFKSKTTIAAFCIPKIPYIMAQVAQDQIVIKNLLKQRSKSPLNPAKLALKRMIKGYQMAIYNAVLLISEIKDLKTISER